MPIFVNHPGAADIKIQPKYPEFLLDMRYFCNFSLVSLGIRSRSRRCAERTRQAETKKAPDRIPETKNDIIYMYIDMLLCSSFSVIHTRYADTRYQVFYICFPLLLI